MWGDRSVILGGWGGVGGGWGGGGWGRSHPSFQKRCRSPFPRKGSSYPSTGVEKGNGNFLSHIRQKWYLKRHIIAIMVT